jgi:taurine dioxygenase
MATKSRLDLRRVTSAVGAVIDGIDLRAPLVPETVRFVRQALLDHGVIFFKDQDLDDAQMGAFVSHFARPIPEPFAADYRPDAASVSTTNIAVGKHATSALSPHRLCQCSCGYCRNAERMRGDNGSA